MGWGWGVVALLSETRGSQPVVGRGSWRGSRTDPMGSSGNPFRPRDARLRAWAVIYRPNAIRWVMPVLLRVRTGI